MNKDSITTNLGIIGALMIVVGTFLFGLFLLGSKNVYFMTNLIPYTVGFLITGLIASIFGFLFTIICLERCEETEINTDNTTKIRAVLIAVTVIFLMLMGYLTTIDYEWTVQPLIIDPFAFYYGFTISSYNAFFATLLTFGIFVLPIVIAETGLLDGYPDEQIDNSDEEGYTIDEAEKAFDRFAAFLKRRFGLIKKIENYTLPIGLAFTVFGSCLVGLPYFYFIDGPLTWDPKTELWFIKDYKGFIRGPLLLIGILFLVIGLVLMFLFRRSKQPNPKKATKKI